MAAKKKPQHEKKEPVEEKEIKKEEVENSLDYQLALVRDEFKKTFTGPKFVAGVKYFTKNDLTQLELHQLKVAVAVKDIALKEVEMQKFINESQEKLQKLTKELEEAKVSYVEKLKKFKEINNEIEKTYKVSMKSISYDDETGRVHESFEFKTSNNNQK